MNSFFGIVMILAMQLGIRVRLNCFQTVEIRPDQSGAFKGKEAGLMGEKVTIDGAETKLNDFTCKEVKKCDYMVLNVTNKLKMR